MKRTKGETMAENREMSGVLFRNRRKVQEKHPDYTGSCKIDGKVYYVSAWIKVSAEGTKYFSMAYTERIVDEGNNPISHPQEDTI